MQLNFGMRKSFGYERMPQNFEGNQENINNTSFTKCHSGQNRKMNIPELFLNWARMGFGIFVEDMIQRIYENFVGIFGNTEI